MKRSLPLYLLLLVLSLCCACTDHHAMMQRLAYVSACNRADTVFTSRWLPTVDSLVSYFDRHGSPNDRMTAHYLQGRVYHDMGEAPRAIDCYQEAVNCTDTTANGCDYYCLAAIYGQMSNIFQAQFLPDDEIAALKALAKMARHDHDTLTEIISIHRLSSPYFMKKDTDSVLAVEKKARELYLKNGYKEYAGQAVLGSIRIALNRQNLFEAKRLMKIYENESGLFDNKEESFRLAPYYIDKGIYMTEVDSLDSAALYFYKAIGLGYHEGGYRGLLAVYEKRNLSDSVAKYARLFAAANDSSFLQVNQEVVHRISSFYNYTRQQKLAEDNKKKAENNRQRFIESSILLIVIIIASFFAILQLRRKRRSQEKKLAETIAERAKIQAELKQLKDAHFEKVISQKEEEINDLNRALTEHKAIYNRLMAKNKVKTFENSNVVELFKRKSEFKHDETMPTNKDWISLVEEFQTDMPTLYTLMTEVCKLSTTELRSCILILIGISEGSIASLLEIMPQTLNTAKARANKKLFKAKGSATLKDNLMQLIVS